MIEGVRQTVHNTGDSRRLFFALWPDDPLRARLRRAVRPAVQLAGGRPVLPADLHLTLAFLGQVPESRLDDVLTAGASVSMPPIRLELDRFGCFPRAGVFWLGPERTPAALTDFVVALWHSLEPLGLMGRGVFRAHVTLCRKVRRAPALPAPWPVVWLAREFVLAESLTVPERRRHYRVLERFPAAESPDTPEVP